MRSAARQLQVLQLAVGLACGSSEHAQRGGQMQAPHPARELGVALARDRQDAAGIALQRLEAATWRPGASAPGSVLDPLPLAALSAQLSTAEAARDASRAELERTRVLHADAANVSKRSLESALAQFRADDDRARLVARQLATGWGRAVAALSAAERDALVARLVGGGAAIARVDLPAGELAGEPVAASVSALGSAAPPIAAEAIDEAPTVNAELPGRSFFLRLVPAASPLRPGSAISVRFELAGEPRHGVVIPREALVRFGGLAWAYVKRGDERFERLAVPLDAPADGGWFTAIRFAPGDQVVVTGAQLLLGEEQRAQLQLGIAGEPDAGQD